MGTNKFTIQFALVAILLYACQPTPPAPTATPRATNTPVLTTATLGPRATTAPTARPTPIFSAEGPNIVYKLTNRVSSPIFIRNGDGTGYKQINLPENAFILQIEDAISPDGKWMAFFQGSSGWPYDLELYLLDIFSEKSILVSKLFSDEFPDDLNAFTETYLQRGVPEIQIDSLEGHVSLSIQRNIAWSPDSKYLAFSAQVEGPSADAYLYEVETTNIRRLTNDLSIVDDFEWSPDGKWLLYENQFFGEIYIASDLFAINIADGTDHEVYDGGFFWGGKGWLATDLYMIGSGGDGCCPHNLESLNIRTGERASLWPGEYERYAYDPDNLILAVTNTREDADENNKGTYLVNIDGETTLVSEGSLLPRFRNGEISRFVGSIRDEIIGIAVDGSSHVISEPVLGQTFSISPDYRWLLVTNPESFLLYDAEDNLVTQIENTIPPKTPIKRSVWRPDGNGVFLVTGLELYYLAIPDGEVQFIEECPESDCWLRYTGRSAWLP